MAKPIILSAYDARRTIAAGSSTIDPIGLTATTEGGSSTPDGGGGETPPPVGTLVVEMTATRLDPSAAPTVRTFSMVPLTAGAVKDTDTLQARLVGPGSVEIPCRVTRAMGDKGIIHHHKDPQDVNGNPTGERSAAALALEFDFTGAFGTTKALTLHIGTAPTQAVPAAQGYQQFDNYPEIVVDSGTPTKLRLNRAIVLIDPADAAPIRVDPATIDYDGNAGSVPVGADVWMHIILRKSDGKLLATQSSGQAPYYPWSGAYIKIIEQQIHNGGGGNVTFGTTNLSTAGLWLRPATAAKTESTGQGNGVNLDCVPRLPSVIATPSDPVYLCSTELVGEALPATITDAWGSDYSNVRVEMNRFLDEQYRTRGAVLSQGNANYSPGLVYLTDWIRTGDYRKLLIAHGMSMSVIDGYHRPNSWQGQAWLVDAHHCAEFYLAIGEPVYKEAARAHATGMASKYGNEGYFEGIRETARILEGCYAAIRLRCNMLNSLPNGNPTTDPTYEQMWNRAYALLVLPNGGDWRIPEAMANPGELMNLDGTATDRWPVKPFMYGLCHVAMIKLVNHALHDWDTTAGGARATVKTNINAFVDGTLNLLTEVTPIRGGPTGGVVSTIYRGDRVWETATPSGEDDGFYYVEEAKLTRIAGFQFDPTQNRYDWNGSTWIERPSGTYASYEAAVAAGPGKGYRWSDGRENAKWDLMGWFPLSFLYQYKRNTGNPAVQKKWYHLMYRASRNPGMHGVSYTPLVKYIGELFSQVHVTHKTLQANPHPTFGNP